MEIVSAKRRRAVRILDSRFVSSCIALLPRLVAACPPPRIGGPVGSNPFLGLALLSILLTHLAFLTALLWPRLRRRLGWVGVLALAGACVLHPVWWVSQCFTQPMAVYCVPLGLACGDHATEVVALFLPVSPCIIGILLWRRSVASRKQQS